MSDINRIPVQAMWAEQNVDKKKQMVLDFILDFENVKTWLGKSTQRKWIAMLHKPSYNKRNDLDKMITNLKLMEEGLKVIR